MPDFDDQLRRCLSHHAHDAAAPAALISDVKARSRQLERRGRTAAVASVVPLTAAVAIGAVALSNGGGPKHVQGLHVRPAASSGPTSSPMARVKIEYGVCNTGTEPRLKAIGAEQRSAASRHTAAGTLLRHPVKVERSGIDHWQSVYYLRVFGSASNGKVVGVETVHRNGKRNWTLALHHSGGGVSTYPAKFLGCGPTK